LYDCGYTGAALYWDWVLDSSAPSQSPVWDPVTGFGGNGVNTGDNGGMYRVVDGPFKNHRPLYFNTGIQPHWLSRNWYPAIPEAGTIELNGHKYTSQVMAEIEVLTTFSAFATDLERGPHDSVHPGVGGAPYPGDIGPMGDLTPGSSPNGKLYPVL
jgi:tyrosinase